MPEPIERGQRYMPGLDGLRALAVLAVLAYHLDIGWAQGGLLGVGVFFTLSGYLITDLLLEQTSRGGIRLGQFWLRRARRLLPALFVMLVVVTAWVTLVEPSAARLAARCGRRGRRLCQQLVADLPGHPVRRPVRGAVAARPPVVARDRGAVLPRVAVRAAARAPIPQGARRQPSDPPPAGAPDPRDGRGLDRADGASLRAGSRFDPGLRRHRHAGVRPADRRRSGDGVARRPAERRGHRPPPAGSSTAPGSPASW